MKRADPPSLAVWLLLRMAPAYRREALIGDLIEEFRSGRSGAWFWREVMQVVYATVGALLQQRAKAKTDRIAIYWRQYRALLLFAVLMCGFRSAWADWVYVPSGSMNPTILEGDRLLVDKHVYGLRVPFSLLHITSGENPRRGDIIVFDSPRNGTSLVKRVIALPGDSVALDGEQLSINGVTARYVMGERSRLHSLLQATQVQEPSILRESGVLPEHDILLLPDRRHWPQLGPVTVPPGMYFVLGDNRDNSADSRYIGFVPRRNIVGRATRVVVSLNPDRYYAPRSGRLLDSLY
jgi:signal peptidase I